MIPKRTIIKAAITPRPRPSGLHALDSEPTRNINMCPACGGHVHNGSCILCTRSWTQAELHFGRF